MFNFWKFKALNDEEKKANFREKIKSYMDRAEIVKRMVDEIKEGQRESEYFKLVNFKKT